MPKLTSVWAEFTSDVVKFFAACLIFGLSLFAILYLLTTCTEALSVLVK